MREEFCWCKTTERVKFIATKSQGCAYDQQHHTKGFTFPSVWFAKRHNVPNVIVEKLRV